MNCVPPLLSCPISKDDIASKKLEGVQGNHKKDMELHAYQKHDDEQLILILFSNIPAMNMNTFFSYFFTHLEVAVEQTCSKSFLSDIAFFAILSS